MRLNLLVKVILIVIVQMATACNDSAEVERVEKEYYAPEWAKKVIWYQIFPERFNNGNPANNPTADRVGGHHQLPEHWEISPWTGDWYERADWEKDLGPDFRDGVFFRRYGGDIQGIMEKLDYLQELGIGAIYLNPVFDAVSLHKYDTSHYHHIDRFFGPDPEGDAAIMEREDPSDPETWEWTSADRQFLRLIEEVHKRDMRIIIDGVFNHTGTDFWAFDDLQKNQRHSRYKEWYDVIEFEDPDTPDSTEFDYHGWWGIKDLPELKEEDGTLVEPVRNHIFNITRRWMAPDRDVSKGVDGWRLDVPEEISTPFWEEWCAVVRSINPEAYIVGEIWDEKASHYLQGGLFSGVMNYQFAKAVQDYMIDREISAHDFADRLDGVRESFPEEANYAVQNLMDSHDTPRLASMILNPGREYDKEGTPEEGFDVRKPTNQERRIQRLISLFQFTYIGAPMIYYGTEAGMWGADDPDDRKPMLWPDRDYAVEKTHPLGWERPEDENKFDHELFNWYKKLAEIRNSYEVLQTGRFRRLHVDSEKNIYAFARFQPKGEFLVVVLNRSDHEEYVEFPLSKLGLEEDTLKDLLSGDEYYVEGSILKATIAPVSGLILSPVSNR